MDVSPVGLYVGPDQIIPSMSILATVMGFIMIFWNKLVGLFRKLTGGSRPPDANPPADAADKELPK